MIVSAGDALIDFVPQALADGGQGFAPRVGGACLNCAVAMSRLGAPVAFVGGVSTDLFGSMIAEKLLADGVSLELATRSDDGTTLAFVTFRGADAAYAFYDEHSAARRWTGPAAPLPDAAEALHFGSTTLIGEPAGAALEALARGVRSRCVVSFDPNCRPSLVDDIDGYRARIARCAAMADVLRFSEEDFAFLHPDLDESDVARDLLSGDASVVLISRGGEGASAYWRGGRLDQRPAPTTVVDTIGAGDTFHAAFLVALRRAGRLRRTGLPGLTEAELQGALAFAARAAALNCARPGCNPPTAAEVDAAA